MREKGQTKTKGARVSVAARLVALEREVRELRRVAVNEYGQHIDVLWDAMNQATRFMREHEHNRAERQS